ncbi:diaminopimelate epimerase [Carnobacterium mobile]|uniref:diaminopimelate epimerase n=1 Tax=Carnobacterium mobile TaxID=2750 RepID=UPI0005502176|nr:diaminopimelate epimerase [Carnobacterium mobile]
MKFIKYHGTGNDFIFVDDKNIDESQLPEIAKKVCHRFFGIGADGLMMAGESTKADIKMNYYNQDGSVAPMCGNGLRCFGRYVHETGILAEERFMVETLAGILSVDVSRGYKDIVIDLNKPTYRLDYPDTVHPLTNGNSISLIVNGREYEMDVLFLGTLHGIILTADKVPDEDAYALCHHEFFPKWINVNFVQILDRKNIKLRTYERGVGYTLACGTGAASSQVIAHKKGLTDEKVKVHVDGGELNVLFADSVILSGPAVKVAVGEIMLENIG